MGGGHAVDHHPGAQGAQVLDTFESVNVAEGSEHDLDMSDELPDKDGTVVDLSIGRDIDEMMQEAQQQLEDKIRQINELDESTILHDTNTDIELSVDQEEDIQVQEGAVRRSARDRQQPVRLEPSVIGKEHANVRGKLMVQLAKKKLQQTRKLVMLALLKSKRRGDKSNDLFRTALNVMFVQAKRTNKKTQVVGEYSQMSAKLGIRKFGEEAIAAMVKEYIQLDIGAFPGKPVIEPITYEDLTKEERREALESINLIKKKRVGTVKGRTCTDGSR